MRTQLLVLARGAVGAVGVDLRTGLLVRAAWADDALEMSRDVAAYDVVDVDTAADERLPFQQDAVVARVERHRGRLTGRRAERLLRPLEHPVSQPLLGGPTPSIPYWTLRSDQPTVALVAPSAGPVVEPSPSGPGGAGGGMRCRFRWRRLDHDLPLADASADERLAHPSASTARLSGATLARALGWRPHRLVVALAEPADGMCQKVVAGILPRP